MGTGYTRNDTLNNIADGNIINASDLDGEFDAVESAFNESTGHTHDGTAAEGAPITVLGPVQDFIASATEIKPKTTNTLDIGTVSLQFKDMYLDGTAYLDDIQAVGAVDITGDLDVDNININGNTISSTDTNGNITLAPNGTGVVALSSTDLTFGDSDKAIFGAGSDLQIYHDGNHSYVTDQGDGNLRLRGSNFVQVLDASGNDMIQAEAGGAVDIYHNGNSKLATTATGVNVTGTVTADGLTVDGDLAVSAANARIRLFETDTTNLNTQLQNQAGVFNIQTLTDSASSATNLVSIDHSTGNVGIGTSSPAQLLHVNTTSASSARIRVQNSEGYAELATDGTDGFLTAGGSEILRFESTGNVGIGTTSPSTPLHVSGSSDLVAIIESTDRYSHVDFTDTLGTSRITNDGGNLRLRADNSDAVASSYLTMEVDGNEAMRIFNNGYVSIGTSSSSSRLHVKGDVYTTLTLDGTAGGQVDFYRGGSRHAQIFTDGTDGDIVFRNNTVQERMRIDGTTGNVGIGTTSPAYTLQVGEGNGQMSLGNATAGNGASRLKFLSSTTQKNWQISTNDSISGALEFTQTTTAGGTTFAASPAFRINSNGSLTATASLTYPSGNGPAWGATYITGHSSSHFINFVTAGTEAMRIDSSQRILCGTTDTDVFDNTSGNGINIKGSAGAIEIACADGETLYLNRMGVDGRVVNIRKSGTFIGGIDVTTSAVSYNTSSDYRLKENITDADDSGSKIDAIQVRQFDWIVDGSHQEYGMIAQELQSVAPEAVSGNPDSDEMMGVDYSKLVPMLIKEVQSLRARVAELENN